MIERCTSAEHPGWLALREQLWPHCSRAEHLAEMMAFLAEPQRYVQFVVSASPGRPVGFVEASIRRDYVNGSTTSPVPFLEGIFVLPESRRQGYARRLLGAVTAWAVAQGYRELASDALLDNTLSHSVHRALGFEETERVVYFRKPLG